MLLNIIFRFLEILVYLLFAVLKSNLFSHYVSKCNVMSKFLIYLRLAEKLL